MATTVPDGGWHEDKPGTNPANQPNGGNNGNHGLIGGNGGVQNPNAGQNIASAKPAGASNGMLGASRTASPQSARSNNGRLSQQHDSNRELGTQQNRSHWSGDGASTRSESNRGHNSMVGHHPQQHMAREHAPAEHHSGGGRRR